MLLRNAIVNLLFCVTLLCLNSDVLARVSPLSSGIIFDDDENAVYVEDYRWGRFTGNSDVVKAPYKIFKIDLKDNSRVIYYEGDKNTLSWLTLSPDKKFISIIKNLEGSSAELFVIDKQLKSKAFSISMPDGIVRYVWSPDSRKIAFISGIIGERNIVKSTGVWVYDLDKMEKTRIADGGSEIEWMKNGEIFVIDYDNKKGKSGMPIDKVYQGAVYRYESGLVSGKKVLGSDFSLDGRYSIGPKYWKFSAMSDEERAKIHYNVYDLQRGIAVPEERLSNIFPNPETVIWGYFYWVEKNRLVFEENRINVGFVTVISDVENNQILKTVKGELVGFNSDRSKIIIYSNGKFIVVKIP